MNISFRNTVFISVLCISLVLLIHTHWDVAFRYCVKIPIVGWLIEYNFPPVDFYRPLASVPLKSGVVNVSFACKYEGRYELNIAGIATNSLDCSGVRLHWEVVDASMRRLRGKEGGGSFVLASGRDTKTAFRYCYDIFFVPRDLPSSTELFATILCSGAVDDLLKQSPMARIEIVKCFDK